MYDIKAELFFSSFRSLVFEMCVCVFHLLGDFFLYLYKHAICKYVKKIKLPSESKSNYTDNCDFCDTNHCCNRSYSVQPLAIIAKKSFFFNYSIVYTMIERRADFEFNFQDISRLATERLKYIPRIKRIFVSKSLK